MWCYNGINKTKCKKDTKGNYWFGTANGLIQCHRHENEFSIVHEYSTHSENGYKLSHNNVFSIHEDLNGNIWIGTFGGGLNKLVLNGLGEPIKIESFRKNSLFIHSTYL